MNYTFELNNARQTVPTENSRKLRKGAPIVETFSAMVNGDGLSSLNLPKGVADKSATYIKELGKKAMAGDNAAVSELNSLRAFIVQPKLIQDMKLLNIFGSYKNIGLGETAEVRVRKHIGIDPKHQAEGVDVPFSAIKEEKYQVPMQTISAGYAVNYRNVALGEMTYEAEGMDEVRKALLNNAKAYCMKKVYESVKSATGVKYFFEGAGLTKTGVDSVLAKIRRYGKANVVGDYALLSQFTPWAGYVGTVGSNTVIGMSQSQLDQIASEGLLGMYNGAILSESPAGVDYNKRNSDGTDFATILPQGLGLVIPSGGNSPINTFTRGNVTTLSGNDVINGDIVTRYDIEVGCDVAKGLEHEIGLIHDINLDELA